MDKLSVTFAVDLHCQSGELVTVQLFWLVRRATLDVHWLVRGKQRCMAVFNQSLAKSVREQIKAFSAVLLMKKLLILQHPYCDRWCLRARNSFVFLSQLNPDHYYHLFVLKRCWLVSSRLEMIQMGAFPCRSEKGHAWNLTNSDALNGEEWCGMMRQIGLNWNLKDIVHPKFKFHSYATHNFVNVGSVILFKPCNRYGDYWTEGIQPSAQ